MSERRWINFARYTSPPIGKGRVLDCVLSEDGKQLSMVMELDGVPYTGTLDSYTLEDEGDEEE